MGDRIVYTIKQADGLSLNLYSHWGGYERFTSLANALEVSRPRWSDEPYAARIIVSQLVNTEWGEETGYGLWASKEDGSYYGGDHPDITIDIPNKLINDETGTHTFEQFIAFHGVHLTEQVQRLGPLAKGV